MTNVMNLTHERLMEVLAYEPATGVFVWMMKTSNRIKIGDRAGVLTKKGYRVIVIDGIKIQATRLAWFYVNKSWPKGDVVPSDGDLDNASIMNLKDVSRVDSARTRALLSNNTSGFKGVSRTQSGRFQAMITWGYRQVNLGNKFETAEDASEVYQEASRRLALTASESDRAQALTELLLWRRQRAAWRLVQRTHPGHRWSSFEEFCLDVTEVPKTRFAMVAADLSWSIGPGNFRWALPVDAKNSTRDGVVAYQRAKREANREHHRDRHIRKEYGIGHADEQRMLLEQKGLCAICEMPETETKHGRLLGLSVDHDHETGAVRGLLCAQCNKALGLFCDSPVILTKAIAYLRRHDGSNVVPFEPAIVSGVLGCGA